MLCIGYGREAAKRCRSGASSGGSYQRDETEEQRLAPFLVPLPAPQNNDLDLSGRSTAEKLAYGADILKRF